MKVMLVPAEMRLRVLNMICDYQRHVAGFVAAAKIKFGHHDLLAAWRHGHVPKDGMLDDPHETRYSFHGVGCRVTSDKAEMEFDFGPDGRHDGFDAWRLHPFAVSHAAEYPEFKRLALLELTLEELLLSEVIFSPRWSPSPHLLYFRAVPAAP
jgi:hypothetical protein